MKQLSKQSAGFVNFRCAQIMYERKDVINISGTYFFIAGIEVQMQSSKPMLCLCKVMNLNTTAVTERALESLNDLADKIKAETYSTSDGSIGFKWWMI